MTTVPSASELKTLRKEWRDLKSRHKRYGNRPRCDSGEGTHLMLNERKKEYDANTLPLMDEILKISTTLIQYDTPTIQKQVGNWAKKHTFMYFIDGTWQGITGTKWTDIYKDELYIAVSK